MSELLLPQGMYKTILADPPWTYTNHRQPDAGHGTASAHYPVLSRVQLAALAPQIDALCDPSGTALFLWATMPLLPEALALMAQWGFRYKTAAFTWAKTTKKGTYHFGLGHWTRANAELCLLGTRGTVKRRVADVPQLIVAPRRRHSQKPDEQYERIERLVDGPYLELFARGPGRPGWDGWGDQYEPLPLEPLETVA